ncbi:adenosylcobinamide-GDP ribazoletransferase [Bacteroides oleiciplenus]|uniref:Adenosylcobinamide-GDP ribazoletransferase n=1 Tax=Bacteroides oleiciplenus YIT 12058 TaxID=742727 RepID=K9EA98_9BACE|nr:adenosylcobinamide-GDP ribazoletransferase [Bacteroides oleiciplenus]EKU92756.1 cobalamin 5'-phosphate synthase [Bacteroides oleiciplenus YIT 12058]
MKILAALIFFTRLPFWRIREVPAEYFKRIVPYWPLTGWLTGGIMVGVLWLTAQVLPISITWLLAIVSRLLVTGCLHEDGLADFFDGFGGGTTRERTLAIMKDSHIGSYGVIGLIVYFLLMFLLLENLPLKLICALVICGDCYSKFCASQIINSLPYARKEEDSKAKVVYDRMTWQESLTGFVCGLLPIVLFLPMVFWPAICLPLFTFTALCRLMKRRLQGYTGDCCGATFLLCELSFYLGAAILTYTYNRYGNPDLINAYFK